MDEGKSPLYADFEDYTKLKYQLTYDLRTLTDNVTRFSKSTESKFDNQDKHFEKIDDKLEEHDDHFDKVDDKLKALPTKKATTEEIVSSLSPSIKWLLVVILGIAFLGALGAAIGINLLDYLNKVPSP